jgi:hypothetical protein
MSHGPDFPVFVKMGVEQMGEETARKRLLVFGCHEAWAYQLSALDYDLDIVIGLEGLYTKTWDTHFRPVPSNARLIGLEQAKTTRLRYHCIIANNVKDLLDVKDRPEPRILVLHLPIEARVVEEKARVMAGQVKDLLHQYVRMVGAHVVAVSAFKGRSWGFTDDVVPFGINTAEYLPSTCQFACGLRIANFILRRRQFLLWDFHEKAFEGIPMMIVGHNPGMPEATPSDDWDHLKRMLSSYRFYVHTADPGLEDGYNMATVEAMAAGLPVLGNCHPTSPIQHGVSGFLSDDPQQVRRFARLLLADRQLAMDMGRQARRLAMERFSLAAFKEAFTRSIETAGAKGRRSTPEWISEVCAPAPSLDAPEPRIIDLAARSRTEHSRRRKGVCP